MCRCNAVEKRTGKECGLPFNHKGSHSRADGAVSNLWSNDEAIFPCPVFVIKASDPTACGIIRLWYIAAQKAGANPDKLSGALERLEEFRTYQANYGTKVPD